jgi:hypothetical protein
MRDELLRQLDKDLERGYLTKEQYEGFKAEITSKADQQDKLVEDRRAGKIEEAEFYQWSESISSDYKEINERWRNTVDKNMKKRQHDAEAKFRRPFVIGFFAVLAIVGVWHTAKYFYEHRSIQDVPEPVQVTLSDEEQEEVHIVEGRDIGMPDYYLEMHYLASYDIQGIVMDTKHMDWGTAFDKSFPVDVSIAWGELAANRDLMSCTNGPRKLSCSYDFDKVMERTEVGRGILDLVSNNHLSPANREIYDKIMRIRKGNYIRLQGYLVRIYVKDDSGDTPFEAVSSLTRKDHMSSIFDTTATGCELIYVTSVEWLD